MIIQIANVIDAGVLDSIRSVLSEKSLWLDGTGTALGHAKAGKNNLQANPDETKVQDIVATIKKTLVSNKLFVVTSRPSSFARLILSRYDQGMKYGEHVDAPYIDSVRTDLSFTLSLSDPASYSGGELVIETPAGPQSLKLPAGGLVVYPSNMIHRVEPVLKGSRLAAVGWLKSTIRSQEHRGLLFELERALLELEGSEEQSRVIRNRLVNLRNNLLRMWGD